MTHDQEEALTLSDHIAVFNKGVVEQIGTPDEVYSHSRTEFVCNFIGDINPLSEGLKAELARAGAAFNQADKCYIRLELIRVNSRIHPDDVELPGIVESSEYYGLYIKYQIDIGCQKVKVVEKNNGTDLHKRGDKVKVVINPGDIMSYPAGKEGAPS